MLLSRQQDRGSTHYDPIPATVANSTLRQEQSCPRDLYLWHILT